MNHIFLVFINLVCRGIPNGFYDTHYFTQLYRILRRQNNSKVVIIILYYYYFYCTLICFCSNFIICNAAGKCMYKLQCEIVSQLLYQLKFEKKKSNNNVRYDKIKYLPT